MIRMFRMIGTQIYAFIIFVNTLYRPAGAHSKLTETATYTFLYRTTLSEREMERTTGEMDMIKKNEKKTKTKAIVFKMRV